MKQLSLYSSLKRKAVELLSKGAVKEYMHTLMQLSQLEKEMAKMSLLN